jgi:hypothetical protein
VVDGAMTDPEAARARIAQLRSAGYGDVRGIHVHTPVDKAVDRARSAWKRGAGKETTPDKPGPRLVPHAALRDAARSHGDDASAQAFDAVRPHLDGWQRWDHSGSAPVRKSRGGKPERKGVTSVEDFTAARAQQAHAQLSQAPPEPSEPPGFIEPQEGEPGGW